MLNLVRKRWFLLLLISGGLVVWLRPDWLRWSAVLEPQLVVATSLFLTALGLESKSLWQALLRPMPAVWSVIISYGLLPVIGWLMGPLLPNDDYRIGLLIISSVPCTLASAVIWTRMAGGNEATALLGILLSTCVSWLTTTGWLMLAAGAWITLDSTRMMRELLFILVLPVALGQVLRVFAPLARAATTHKVLLSVLARILIFAIILKAAMDVRDRLAEGGAELAVWPLVLTAVICVGAHVLALGGGITTSKWLGFDRGDQLAVAFASSQKTLPVALYLFDAYFKSYPLAVVPMVFYHVGQLVVDTFIAEEMAGRHNASDAEAVEAGA